MGAKKGVIVVLRSPIYANEDYDLLTFIPLLSSLLDVQ